MAASITVVSASSDATMRIGRLLAGLLRPGDILTLDGDMGAGKTALTRGIASGLGYEDAVASPTFTVVMEHPPRNPGDVALFHFDVYRLRDGDDFLDAGLDEYFSRHGISVIEWGDIVDEVLPPNRFRIIMQGVGDERLLKIIFPEDRKGDLLRLTDALNEDPEVLLSEGGLPC